MTTPLHDIFAAPPIRTATAEHWLRRLCARLGGWCDYLLDTHNSRIPF